MAKKTNIKISEEISAKKASNAAVGRRKRAVARVRLYLGEGESFINGKPALSYCTTLNQKKKLYVPFITAGLVNKYHFSAKVIGGGSNSQVDAVVHAISRSIAQMSTPLRSTMSQNGLLKRDPREKERKKIYRLRARKMPQFAKR